MDESSEIKFLKARVALLETEKKHLIQKVADLGKKKSEAPRHILSSSSNVSIIPEENQPDYPIEQKIQLLKRDCCEMAFLVIMSPPEADEGSLLRRDSSSFGLRMTWNLLFRNSPKEYLSRSETVEGDILYLDPLYAGTLSYESEYGVLDEILGTPYHKFNKEKTQKSLFEFYH